MLFRSNNTNFTFSFSRIVTGLKVYTSTYLQGVILAEDGYLYAGASGDHKTFIKINTDGTEITKLQKWYTTDIYDPAFLTNVNEGIHYQSFTKYAFGKLISLNHSKVVKTIDGTVYEGLPGIVGIKPTGSLINTPRYPNNAGDTSHRLTDSEAYQAGDLNFVTMNWSDSDDLTIFDFDYHNGSAYILVYKADFSDWQIRHFASEADLFANNYSVVNIPTQGIYPYDIEVFGNNNDLLLYDTGAFGTSGWALKDQTIEDNKVRLYALPNPIKITAFDATVFGQETQRVTINITAETEGSNLNLVIDSFSNDGKLYTSNMVELTSQANSIPVTSQEPTVLYFEFNGSISEPTSISLHAADDTVTSETVVITIQQLPTYYEEDALSINVQDDDGFSTINYIWEESIDGVTWDVLKQESLESEIGRAHV